MFVIVDVELVLPPLPDVVLAVWLSRIAVPGTSSSSSVAPTASVGRSAIPAIPTIRAIKVRKRIFPPVEIGRRAGRSRPSWSSLLRGPRAVVVERCRHVGLIREPHRHARRREGLLAAEEVERAAGDRIEAG